MSIVLVTHLHISSRTTSPHDAPIYQIIPPSTPHPELGRFSWVLDHRFGTPQIHAETRIFLWFPGREDLIAATVGPSISTNDEYELFHLQSIILGSLPPVARPRYPYLTPPVELTALRFIAYAQLAPPAPEVEAWGSLEAVLGHTPPPN